VRRLAKVPLAETFRQQPRSQVAWKLMTTTIDSHASKAERVRMLMAALDEVKKRTGAGYTVETWSTWGAEMES